MEIQSQSAVTAQTVVVQGTSAAAVKTTGQTAAVAAPDRKALEEAIRDMEKLINVTEPPQLQLLLPLPLLQKQQPA